jgi:hypothetical protein
MTQMEDSYKVPIFRSRKSNWIKRGEFTYESCKDSAPQTLGSYGSKMRPTSKWTNYPEEMKKIKITEQSVQSLEKGTFEIPNYY